MPLQDTLESYRKKRNFGLTPEPATGGQANAHAPVFVIQKHWASRLHYDFRLEFEGTLKSWAVPKGPSLDPHDKRMAVQVEDHPLSYGDFEGTIPKHQYGAGHVIVWDSGTWMPTEDPTKGFLAGRLKFELRGHKLKGRWTLIRMHGKSEKQIPWLLIKERDEHSRRASDYDITQALPDSVRKPSLPQAALSIKPGGRKTVTPGFPPGSVKGVLPTLLQPQLATLAESPPTGDGWIYELKFDGYRLLTRIDGDHVQCFTRNGHDWTAKMPALVAAINTLGLGSAWVDGEITVPDASGIPDFGLLQNAFEKTDSVAASMVYYLFDLPFYAGHDLRGVALLERRTLLKHIMENTQSPQLRFSDTFEAAPRDLIASACKLGFEGLIAKRSDAGYSAGRSTDWIKLKCGQRQEFVICGYTDPKGARSGLGALLLGVHDDKGDKGDKGGLKYAGNVGSGFTEKSLADLLKQLGKLASKHSPFDKKTVIGGHPHWVRPVLIAEVSFAAWTSGGRIRHGVFRGLRSDKKPGTITRETAMSPAALKSATRTHNEKPALPASLRVTHPERIIDTKSGVTKLDVIQHYAAVASLMLPHLKGRPVSLVRAPAGVDGELFFQKHVNDGELPGVKLLDASLDPGHDSLLEISNLTGLLSAAQMNTLEFHTWNASASAIAKPDRMTFDLDPGDKLPWAKMQEAAMLVRTLLKELGLPVFLKTSGGKGLHLVIPLKRMQDWATVTGFSHAIVKHLASTIPQRFVAKSGPNNRIGKIFVDYLRNGFGATTVSAWSARARPDMGVSVPLAWDELADLTGGDHWKLQNLASRLPTGNQPWADYAISAQSLSKAMKIMGFQKPRDTPQARVRIKKSP